MPTKYKINLHNIIKFQVAGEKNLTNLLTYEEEDNQKQERKANKNLIQNQENR